MGFSRQECWSELAFPPPGDLPDLGIEPSLAHCRQTLHLLSHQESSYMLKPILFGDETSEEVIIVK